MKKNKHTDELRADIEKLVDHKLLTPRYKHLAHKHQVSEQTIRRLVWQQLHSRTIVRVQPNREEATMKE